MEDHHQKIAEEHLFFFEQETVTVEDFKAEGFILDIGGGGEGIIGKLKGKQVIAIDANKRELEEAATGPLKIVMDATDLKFLDESFKTATAFYTLMYIKENALRQVFGEVHRVLAPGGRFLIWDVILPPRIENEKDVAVFLLTVILGEETVETGYGMLWSEEGRSASTYAELAKRAGFAVVAQQAEGRRLFLELKKL